MKLTWVESINLEYDFVRIPKICCLILYSLFLARKRAPVNF